MTDILPDQNSLLLPLSARTSRSMRSNICPPLKKQNLRVFGSAIKAHVRGAQITHKTGMAEETSWQEIFFANMHTALTTSHTII
jgi:hypothetical protein